MKSEEEPCAWNVAAKKKNKKNHDSGATWCADLSFSVHPYPHPPSLSGPFPSRRLSHMPLCLHAVILSLCVWPGSMASASTPSLPPLTWRWTLLLGYFLTDAPACPPASSSELSWLISELNAEPTEHQLWELPCLRLYLSISLYIYIPSNKCVCAHAVLRCAGLGIFLSPVQSILHKPLDCEDMRSPREHANGVPDTDTPQ